ncbi:MAG TPA: UDP-glucose 4-epimerase GalE [Polyangiaceae bacterium]|nr:UDP-glucose 4-epimerase GalE [Polyangiaceae bacterium]
MRVLVTGGAGYIGSHMALGLLREGHHVAVIDDLSAGRREAVPAGAVFVEADVADGVRVGEVLRRERIEAVLHFAGRIQVGESVGDPRRYYAGNVVASAALVDTVLDAGVTRFIFSSTAAVYGEPIRVPIDEDHPTSPVNPYGDTKLAVERMLAAYGRAYGLRWAALRYFNAAGADVEAGLDERHEPETHLVPIVVDVALGRREAVTVFGDDYDTPDGTCVRDYIHVLDLCDAHRIALDHLTAGGAGGAFNLGTGEGHSVSEVVDVVRRVSGREVRVLQGPRRAGDPPRLVASPERAARVLGWRARRVRLEDIVRDVWQVRSARS